MSNVTADQFAQSVLSAFDTAWADETEIAAPNVKFDPDGKDEWVRLYILGAPEGVERYSSSVANNFWSRRGVLTIQCYVKQNTDTDRVYFLAEKAMQWLENPGVPQTIFSTRSSPVENGPDGTWFQVTVAAEFQYFTDRAA